LQGIADSSAWARGQGWAINGFTMMYRYTKDQKYLDYGYTKNEAYLNYSKKVIKSLETMAYVLPEQFEAPFILDHSFGDWSKRSEMNEPIVYGDYYYLQTLIRIAKYQNTSSW